MDVVANANPLSAHCMADAAEAAEAAEAAPIFCLVLNLQTTPSANNTTKSITRVTSSLALTLSKRGNKRFQRANHVARRNITAGQPKANPTLNLVA
jgi:hypothetical protein